MKAKEFIPATKPRNFVAKNQKTAGAGSHKYKRKAEKQGNVKHKRDLMPMEAGWKDEADDFSEWTDYVKERLTKASPEQRLSLAKKLSQVEVKSFGSSLGGGFDRNTGKAKTGELTDTVRSALRYFNSEQDSIRRQRDQDGAPGNFSMPFGSVDIPGMENATPEELAVMKKAVMMGPEVAGAAAKLYKKNGTITSQDLKDIESSFEKTSGIEFGKPMYSSPEAKAGRERAMAGEGVAEGSDNSASATPAKNERGRFTALDDDEPMRLKCEDGEFRTIQEINVLRQKMGMKPFSIKSQQGVAEGAEDLTPNIAKYVLDQIYNSNGAVTMTDLFDEGIPGLRDMFMATAEELGLDPDEDFMDIESAVLEKLEELISGPNEMSERVRDPEDWDEGNTEPGNNFAVYINGKKWKVFPGPAGAYADSPEEKREFARLQAMAQRKSQESGKKWEVYVTGEPATR